MNNCIACLSLRFATVFKLSLFAFPLALMREGRALKISHISEVPPHNTDIEGASDCHALLTRTRFKLDFFQKKIK